MQGSVQSERTELGCRNPCSALRRNGLSGLIQNLYKSVYIDVYARVSFNTCALASRPEEP
jgi:hypothetical protein